jgi:hypothetical protein
MGDVMPADFEADARFPSGPWTGFFLQYWLPGRHATDVRLSFRNGDLSGEGRDRVGPYTVDGTYDRGTGKCEWTKRYVGRHRVYYRGINDGRGIWGVWELPQLGGWFVDRGGFHLWPEGTDVSEESDRTAEAVAVMMHQEFGGRIRRVVRGLVVLAATVGLAILAYHAWPD